MTDVIDPKQVDELSEALRLTIISKEDALARATAENQKLRDELEVKRESWYTRYLTAQQERDRCRDAKATEVERRHQAEDRATQAEEGLREAGHLLDQIVDLEGSGISDHEFARIVLSEIVPVALVHIKELLPP